MFPPMTATYERHPISCATRLRLVRRIDKDPNSHWGSHRFAPDLLRRNPGRSGWLRRRWLRFYSLVRRTDVSVWTATPRLVRGLLGIRGPSVAATICAMPKIIPKLPRNAEAIDPETHPKSSAKSVRKASKRAA